MEGQSSKVGGKLRRFGPKKRIRSLLQKFFSAEIEGNVEYKVVKAINEVRVPYKIFKTKLGYSRV